jgi:CheY-like chemotaxis protein
LNSILAGKLPPVVLVVEDEPLLRMLAVEAVEEAGFIAIEAGGADEAVVLLESRTDITLLFTDINMPGSMDGLKLAHAVRNRWPPIKILVVSGQQQLQSAELPSNSRFFGKPYQASSLVEELRSMIGYR